MDSIEKIEYLYSLEYEKKQLEEEIKNVDNELSTFQEECDHINVILGSNGPFPLVKCRCLFCGKRYSFHSKYSSVDASNFLTQYDINDYSKCDEKFDKIRILAFGLMKEEMEGEELVRYLNSFIQDCINDKISCGDFFFFGKHCEKLRDEAVRRLMKNKNF